MEFAPPFRIIQGLWEFLPLNGRPAINIWAIPISLNNKKKTIRKTYGEYTQV